MKRRIQRVLAVVGIALVTAGNAGAAELRGSMASMTKQYEVARAEEYAFSRTAAQVREQVAEGKLVRVEANADFTLSNVSYPYAHAELRAFVARLGAEYRRATGERLVVTSLTRPKAAQPANGHRLSVHPAGMAVDFRVPASATTRAWLENRLLALEGEGVLDVTREKRPPHYHVAVYPEQYSAYAAMLPELAPVAKKAEPVVAPRPVAAPVASAEPSATTGSEVRDALLIAVLLPVLVLSGLVGHRVVTSMRELDTHQV